MKDRSKNNFIEWKCPICGKIIKLKPHKTKGRKTCGDKKCLNKNCGWETGITNAKKTIHENNLKRKEIIKQDIIRWVLDNKELVNNCPYNSITKTLSGLQEIISEKYEIKDLRSIFICFKVIQNIANDLFDPRK